MEAAERMLNIASVEPLLNQTVSAIRRRSHKRAARTPARSFDMRLASLNACLNARELQSECSANLERARNPYLGA